MLRVLVDADNVLPRRIQPVLDLVAELVAELGDVARITASGRSAALDLVRWPLGTQLLPHAGWQQADMALAAAYSPAAEPLVLVTGDGDFGLLASRHPGPVLVISGAASGRLRDGTTVVDPAADGPGPGARLARPARGLTPRLARSCAAGDAAPAPRAAQDRANR